MMMMMMMIREPAWLYTGGLLLAWQIDAPKSRLCSLPWKTWARSCRCWWFCGIGNCANLCWTMPWTVWPRSHTRDHLWQKIKGLWRKFCFHKLQTQTPVCKVHVEKWKLPQGDQLLCKPCSPVGILQFSHEYFLVKMLTTSCVVKKFKLCCATS